MKTQSKPTDSSIYLNKINELEQQIVNLNNIISQYESKHKQIGDDEQICIDQLIKLNNLSKERELDLREAKKFEIFTKALRSIRGNDNSGVVNTTEKVPTAKLLEIANGS